MTTPFEREFRAEVERQFMRLATTHQEVTELGLHELRDRMRVLIDDLFDAWNALDMVEEQAKGLIAGRHRITIEEAGRALLSWYPDRAARHDYCAELVAKGPSEDGPRASPEEIAAWHALLEDESLAEALKRRLGLLAGKAYSCDCGRVTATLHIGRQPCCDEHER